MPKPHDRGSWPTDEPIDRTEHQLLDWEKRVEALHGVLHYKGLITTHQWRRAIEGLGPEQYESLTYHERWATALETLLVEQGVVTEAEVNRKLAELEQGKK